MRIALHHPWDNAAEQEACKRYTIAAKNLSSDIVIKEVRTSQEILKFKPDFVLSLTYNSPKLTAIPTYHIANLPIIYHALKNSNSLISTQLRGMMTFDAFLTASPKIKQWIEDFCYGLNKECNILEGYANTFPSTAYHKVNLKKPRLAYVGKNWDIENNRYRFHDLFDEIIARSDYLQVFGEKKGWSHINRKTYGGDAPFDGLSILNRYRECGVGLSLHRDEFIKDDVVNHRIFEICASGSVCISDRLPFIENNFGDSVLYVEQGTARSMASQIIHHMNWIKQNPEAALEKAKKAHDIFLAFSLERMLEKIIHYHIAYTAKEKTFPIPAEEKKPLVSIIVRTGSRPIEMVKRAIDSIAQQDYKKIELIVALYKPNLAVKNLLNLYQNQFTKIQLIEINEKVNYRSTSMWAGLKAVSGDYFGFLDDDDEFFPNHISSTLKYFIRANDPELGVVYPGAVEYLEDGYYTREQRAELNAQRGLEDVLTYVPIDKESARLALFGPFNWYNFLSDANTPSILWLAKRSLLNEQILINPFLHTAEDFYLLLLLTQKKRFAFSSVVTCKINHRVSNYEQSTVLVNKLNVNDQISKRRISWRLWTKEFPSYPMFYHRGVQDFDDLRGNNRTLSFHPLLQQLNEYVINKNSPLSQEMITQICRQEIQRIFQQRSSYLSPLKLGKKVTKALYKKVKKTSMAKLFRKVKSGTKLMFGNQYNYFQPIVRSTLSFFLNYANAIKEDIKNVYHSCLHFLKEEQPSALPEKGQISTYVENLPTENPFYIDYKKLELASKWNEHDVKITFYCASRKINNPNFKLEGFIESLIQHCSSLESIELLIAIDPDDELDYFASLKRKFDDYFRIRIFVMKTRLGYTNLHLYDRKLFKHVAKTTKMLCDCSDDCVFILKNFDLELLKIDQKYKDNIYFIHTRLSDRQIYLGDTSKEVLLVHWIQQAKEPASYFPIISKKVLDIATLHAKKFDTRNEWSPISNTWICDCYIDTLSVYVQSHGIDRVHSLDMLQMNPFVIAPHQRPPNGHNLTPNNLAFIKMLSSETQNYLKSLAAFIAEHATTELDEEMNIQQKSATV